MTLNIPVKTNIQLTATEISTLWSLYFQESINLCLLKHFLQHLKDEEIRKIAEETASLATERLDWVRNIFQTENFPVPIAFSDDDVNFNAPALFHDPFVLSYLYMSYRISIVNFSFQLTSVARLDILRFLSDCMHVSTNKFSETVELMLSKGIYDRPPKINYPVEIEFIHKKSFLNGFFGVKRSLTALELSEINFNIERNYFGVLVMIGFAQVTKDEQIKQYLIDGKQISQKQLKVFNELLLEEELLGNIQIDMEVTDSTTSPFSDKLIMAMVSALNAIDITLISHALSMSMRADLSTEYMKYIAKVITYNKDGFDIMVDREWLEQPPLASNRAMQMMET